MLNYVKVTNRKPFQNKIFPELNSKKHTPSFDFYEIAELRKTWISQKRNRAILREMTFANEMNAQRKKKISVSFRKNCAKVLRMETLFMDSKISFPGSYDRHWFNKDIQESITLKTVRCRSKCVIFKTGTRMYHSVTGLPIKYKTVKTTYDTLWIWWSSVKIKSAAINLLLKWFVLWFSEERMKFLVEGSYEYEVSLGLKILVFINPSVSL